MDNNSSPDQRGLARVKVVASATLFFVLLAAAAAGGLYVWWKNEATKDEKRKLRTEIKTLQTTVDKLNSEKQKLETRVDLLIRRLAGEKPEEGAGVSVSSAQGNIVVSTPYPGESVSSPFTISGRARVFEAALNWRVKNASGKTIGEGTAMTSAGAPEWGEFKTEIEFEPPVVTEVGAIEVYSISAESGEIEEIASVQVVLKKELVVRELE